MSVDLTNNVLKIQEINAKLTMLNRDLLLRQIKQTESAGGIHLPDTAQKSSNRFLVLAVGDGYDPGQGAVRPLRCQPGDTVVVHPDSCIPCHLFGENLVVTDEDGLICVLKG